MTKPTLEQFAKYQAAYDYFNHKLFRKALCPCLLVFREGKKKGASMVLGHFAPNRWTKGKAACHEISLNPEALHLPFPETMSTLVHEMVHQWQHDHGDPPRAGYHNREWAAKMNEVGLVPSDTGQPGGKQTGQRMDHYIEPAGAFKEAIDVMPAKLQLPWITGGVTGEAKPKKDRNKVKYLCEECAINIWGKPGLHVICGECEGLFAEA